MPEFPDIVVYIEALEQRILGQTLDRVHLGSPFLLRTTDPPINTVLGRKVVVFRRLGKRICIGLEGDLWLVIHLMIAGRLHWHEKPVKASRVRLAVFEFPNGTLSLTEAGTKRRASLHVIQDEADLERLNPGGLEIFETDLKGFAAVLQATNHTLKRSLTDPRIFSGIGNAYSDEILWHAQLSPIALTQKLTSEEIQRLFKSTQATLTHWVELLRAEVVKDVEKKPVKQSRTGESVRPKTPARDLGSSRLSRKGDCVSSRDGRSRSLRTTMSALPCEGATYPLRVQRNQLLPRLPNCGEAARGPRSLAPPPRGLAPNRRRVGRASPPVHDTSSVVRIVGVSLRGHPCRGDDEIPLKAGDLVEVSGSKRRAATEASARSNVIQSPTS